MIGWARPTPGYVTAAYINYIKILELICVHNWNFDLDWAIQFKFKPNLHIVVLSHLRIYVIIIWMLVHINDITVFTITFHHVLCHDTDHAS